MAYPDCLSALPAALSFLEEQSGVAQVGVIGISLGGALAIRSLVEREDQPAIEIKALTIVATPIELNYNDAMFYREAWRTISMVPIISLFRKMSARQARQSWYTGGYRTRHSTAQLIELLNPLQGIGHLKHIPTLLVYSHRDSVAPFAMSDAILQVTEAQRLESKKASHITLTLLPEINQAVARWLRGILLDQ